MSVYVQIRPIKTDTFHTLRINNKLNSYKRKKKRRKRVNTYEQRGGKMEMMIIISGERGMTKCYNEFFCYREPLRLS